MAQLVVNILAGAAVYGLMALGFGLIYNCVRFFHFAHGAVYAWGGYGFYLGTRILGLPLWLGAAVGVLLSTMMGIGCETLVYRPLRRRGSSAIALLIVGLGLYIVLENVLALSFGNQNQTVRTWTLPEAIDIVGARISSAQLLTIGTGIISFVVAAIVLYRTRIGLAIRAAGEDRELAAVTGINLTQVVAWTFMFGSALAGISAVLRSLELDISPGMGFQGLLMGVVAAIVGGIGRIEGAVVGALVIATAQHLTIWFLPSQWSDAITFAILIAFLLFRPQGVFGRPLRGATV